MDKEDCEKIISLIRKAYENYPDTEIKTVNMIQQALRIGFVRGQNSARSLDNDSPTC